MEHDRAFWANLDELVRTCRLVVDRPRGSAHPRYPDYIYPLDYGYLAGTTAVDGGGIDVWRGSLPEPALGAILVTVDMTKRDSEIKLLLGCTEAETLRVWRDQNEAGMHALLLRRPAD